MFRIGSDKQKTYKHMFYGLFSDFIISDNTTLNPYSDPSIEQKLLGSQMPYSDRDAPGLLENDDPCP